MKILFFGKVRNFFKTKKKVLLLMGMALLLVGTGVLNYKLNTITDDTIPTSNANVSFFSSYREDRTKSRETQIELLNEIVNNAYATEAERASATQAKQQLVSKMEQEQILEGLIRAKGYDDAVVTIGSEYYNVLVKSVDLTSEQANQILSIVVQETGCKASNVKIVSVEQ